MPFATEAEQIRKFENDEVAQHYFEVLRTLISKKSIFGLADIVAGTAVMLIPSLFR